MSLCIPSKSANHFTLMPMANMIICYSSHLTEPSGCVLNHLRKLIILMFNHGQLKMVIAYAHSIAVLVQKLTIPLLVRITKLKMLEYHSQFLEGNKLFIKTC